MIERKSIRAILLTPDGHVLLMQAREPASNFTVWFAPGGGVEPTETSETCLRRELKEETGVTIDNIGPLIWHRQHTFDWGGQKVFQSEDFYLVRTALFDPDFTTNPSETELMSFRQFKWWSVDQIVRSCDVFAPRELAKHLRDLNDNGIPATTIDVGI